MTVRFERFAKVSSGPAFAGLLFAFAPIAAQAFDLPATHLPGKMLHPGTYACLDGTTPTSEFDVLDGTAYFLRGATLRAGEFAYDRATSVITWKSGPFADAGIAVTLNTTRAADKKPVIVIRYEPDGETPSTEFCTIVE